MRKFSLDKFGITLLLLLLALTIVGLEKADAMSLQVAPNRLVFKIDQSNTQVVVVTNTSNRTLRVKVYPEAAPGQPKEEYLGDWVVVYPRLLSLAPHEKKIVRFSVRPPQKLADGEYRSLLFFEELPVEEEDSKKDGSQLGLQLLTKLGINIYGQYGRIVQKGELSDVQLNLAEKKLAIQGNFKNLGNAHLLMSARVLILDTNQQIVKDSTIPVFAVHRGNTAIFKQEMDFQGSGNFTLKILFKMEDVVIHEFNKTFEIQNVLR